jgi:septal ring factor EnvC (AmiA/AmiB activator)
MNWAEILTIIVPLGSFMAWVCHRIDKKFEAVDKKFENVDRRFESVLGEIKDLRKDVQSIDSRVARIEGQLTGVYHWEPKWNPPNDDRKVK